jgi:hypothetical protein
MGQGIGHHGLTLQNQQKADNGRDAGYSQAG